MVLSMKMDFGSRNGACLETVRALHQTVVSLRAALEQSKSEIIELKTKAWPLDSVENLIKSLSIENHVLRQKIIDHDSKGDAVNADLKSDQYLQGDENFKSGTNLSSGKTLKGDQNLKGDAALKGDQNLKGHDIFRSDFEGRKKGKDFKDVGSEERQKVSSEIPKTKLKHKKLSPSVYSSTCSIQWEQSSDAQQPKTVQKDVDSTVLIATKSFKSPRRISQSLENLASEKPHSLTLSKTVSFSNIAAETDKPRKTRKYYYFAETMSFDVNSTKSNDENDEEKAINDQSNDLEQDQEVDEVELIFTTDDTKEQDFKEALVSIDETTETAHHQLLQCPPSDFELSRESNLSCELEDDVFNDTFEADANPDNLTAKDAKLLYNSKSDNSINQEEKSLKSYYSYQDSSFDNKSLEKDESFDRFEEKIRIIETDISKIGIQDVEYSLGRRNTCPNPLQYRPMSHRDALGKGVNTSRKSRPILAHSNAIRRESGAQTDISALPSSSWRSESSLAHKVKGGEHFTTLPSKFPLPGSKLRLADKTVEARRVLLSDIGFTSMVPELSRSADHICPPTLKPPSHSTFGQFLRTPDLYSPGFTSQRFTWATAGSPSEGSHTHSRYSSIYPLSSPLAQTRRCSAPVSPSRRSCVKYTPSKVKFANGSLPELRTEWSTMDSGDSTDSLVDEAENYLRRSIECIRDKDYTQMRESKGARRASAPEASRDNIPPQGWQPFLPRLPRDLRLDYWVKVITSEGRVRGGRVRYVGPLGGTQKEHFVGVQLSTPDGISDGTFSSRRYFQCEAYHGIFVPFKKVVMGWRP